VDSVVYECTDGSEVLMGGGGLDACRPASLCTSRPTVSRLAAAFYLCCCENRSAMEEYC